VEYPLRRKERKMDEGEALGILRRCDWGVLSLVGSDGTPYGVPLNYVLEEQGETMRLVMHCAREGRKIDCLKANPLGAFVVVEGARMLPEKFSTAYASAMVSGPVDIVDGREEKRELLRRLVARLSPEFTARGEKHIEHRLDDCLVLRLEIRTVCAKGRKTEEPYALEQLGF